MRAWFCVFVKFEVLFKGRSALISVLILFRYSSILAGGASMCFFLEGVWLVVPEEVFSIKVVERFCQFGL